MTTEIEITAICDNGGGITLQVIDGDARYQHTYQDAKQCATDIKVAVEGGDITEWDGNEAEGYEAFWLDPSGEDIRNGGYRLLDIYDLARPYDADANYWGANVRELMQAIASANIKRDDAGNFLLVK